MRCPLCHHPEGIYSEHETFQAGGDPEWSISYSWQCLGCNNWVSSYSDDFEYEDE